MLAITNLQMPPVEPLDDTTLTPASGTPSEGAAGFADMLRLRVDEPLGGTAGSGELLPPGGSVLPITTELTSPDALSDTRPMPLYDPVLWRPKMDPGLVKLSEAGVANGEPDIQGEAPDLLLQTPVIYPSPTSVAETDHAGLPVALPALPANPAPTALAPHGPKLESAAEGRQSVAVDPRLSASPGAPGIRATLGPTPIPDGREARAQNLSGEVALPLPHNLGSRERGQAGEPPARLVPASLANTALDVDAAPTDLSRRLDLTPLKRADGRPEPGFDMLQQRFAVAPPPQAPQAPGHGPLSQPSPLLAPISAAAADFGYAALAQQSADLINTSVRDAAWGQQISDRVVMMASNHLRHAEIRLTPAELGPLRVQVSVEDGATHVTFHAQHAVTREALEQALPRLREMLAENGLSLGQADVSDRGVADGGRERDSNTGASNGVAEDTQEMGIEMGAELPRRPASANGLVDTFV
jgi:flagellar hook-length control protein FliK